MRFSAVERAAVLLIVRRWWGIISSLSSSSRSSRSDMGISSSSSSSSSSAEKSIPLLSSTPLDEALSLSFTPAKSNLKIVSFRACDPTM